MQSPGECMSVSPINYSDSAETVVFDSLMMKYAVQHQPPFAFIYWLDALNKSFHRAKAKEQSLNLDLATEWWLDLKLTSSPFHFKVDFISLLARNQATHVATLLLIYAVPPSWLKVIETGKCSGCDRNGAKWIVIQGSTKMSYLEFGGPSHSLVMSNHYHYWFNERFWTMQHPLRLLAMACSSLCFLRFPKTVWTLQFRRTGKAKNYSVISMFMETFYGHHNAQRRLLCSLTG